MMGAAAGRSVFAGYHPLINYLWFCYAILVPILFFHPVYLAISFISAISYAIYLGGRKTARFALCFVLPLMLVAALFNPAFNHKGATMLFYIRYNPITLEAILYGVCAAVMIGGVILCFSCYNAIMTSDKFIYLFGRVVPSMSLIISMALRFIPRYRTQIKRISAARRMLGFDMSSGKMSARVKSGGHILSVMVTWALENGVETSDSMMARGYGLPGRSAYSDYRFDARDRILLIVFAVLMAVSVAAIVTSSITIKYYPLLIMKEVTPFAQIAYVCHFAVCLIPLFLEIREDMIWRSSRAGIANESLQDDAV